MAEQSSLDLPSLPGIDPGWEILTIQARRVAGNCTADSLERDQDKLDGVVNALAEGLSVRKVARAYGLSNNLVLAVKARFGGRIDTEKERLGALCLGAGRMAVERIIDEIDEMPKASLAIIAGVMVDKGQLLMGAPTARIAQEHHVGVADFAAYISSLPSAAPVNEGGNGGKGVDAVTEVGALGAGTEVSVAGGEGDNGRTRDSQSLVFSGVAHEAEADRADSVRIDGEIGGKEG